MCVDLLRAFLPHGVVGCKKYIRPQGPGRSLRQHPFNILKQFSEESSKMLDRSFSQIACAWLRNAGSGYLCCAALNFKLVRMALLKFQTYDFDLAVLLYQALSMHQMHQFSTKLKQIKTTIPNHVSRFISFMQRLTVMMPLRSKARILIFGHLPYIAGLLPQFSTIAVRSPSLDFDLNLSNSQPVASGQWQR